MGEGINGIAAKVGQDVSHDPDCGIVGVNRDSKGVEIGNDYMEVSTTSADKIRKPPCSFFFRKQVKMNEFCLANLANEQQTIGSTCREVCLYAFVRGCC
jgi:hypothetical protein